MIVSSNIIREDNMDETTYKRWWQLHLRMAKGETLTPAEQAEYDAGVEILDTEEKEQFEPNKVTVLRQLRAQVEGLQTTHAQLTAESARLDKRIAALEKAYQALTGYQLATEPHASS
jgi:hypothetical protein